MNETTQTPKTVLIVEDHPPTAHLLELAFEEIAPEIATEVYETGDAAIERLQRIESGATIPSLVLLDLDLPIKSGYEILEWRNEIDALSRIPFVVLSGTSRNMAASRCYDLHAQSYITKPEKWEEFTELVAVLVKYWFNHAEQPVIEADSDGEITELRSKQ